jgi:hypothetical protein
MAFSLRRNSAVDRGMFFAGPSRAYMSPCHNSGAAVFTLQQPWRGCIQCATNLAPLYILPLGTTVDHAYPAKGIIATSNQNVKVRSFGCERNG